MADLHEKIDEGEYSIEIKETRVGRLVVLNKGGERTLSPSEHEELEGLLDEYEDLILDLADANEEYEGKERAWEMGRLYKKVEEEDQRTFTALNQMLPFVDGRNRKNYLFRRFYEMFPDKAYGDAHPASTLQDLAQRAGPERAREIYDEHLRDYEHRIQKDEVRAWQEAEDSSPDEVIRAVQEKVTNPSVQKVKNVYRIFGMYDPPSDEEIREALNR